MFAMTQRQCKTSWFYFASFSVRMRLCAMLVNAWGRQVLPAPKRAADVFRVRVNHRMCYVSTPSNMKCKSCSLHYLHSMMSYYSEDGAKFNTTMVDLDWFLVSDSDSLSNIETPGHQRVYYHHIMSRKSIHLRRVSGALM